MISKTGLVLTLILALLYPTSTCSERLPPVMDLTLLETPEPQCNADLTTLRQGIAANQPWALTMWDASVKWPVGVLSQTAVQFGDFDECLTVTSPVAAQYCLVDVSPMQGTNVSSWSSFKWAICVPASCSRDVLQTALQHYMDRQGDGVRTTVGQHHCTSMASKSTPVTLVDGLFLAVIASVFAVVGAATVYDFIKYPEDACTSHPSSAIQCLSARRGLANLPRPERAVPGLNLKPLYGLRSLAMVPIIVGHRFAAHLFFMTLTNYRDVEQARFSFWYSIWFSHADLFVDVFFGLAAFMLSLMYADELQKHFISPLKVYMLRLIRLVPMCFVAVGTYATILRHLGEGPLWNLYIDGEQSYCRNYGWTSILFINNYVEEDKMCIPQTWFISCEFQLSVVGTLLILLLHKNLLLGLYTAAALFLGSTVLPFLSTYYYDKPPLMLFYKDFWTDARHHDMFTSVYSQAHYRGTSYLPGLLAGYYVYTHRHQTLSKVHTYSLQIMGILCSLLVYWSGAFFTNPSVQHSKIVGALYAAFFHTGFAFGNVLFLVSLTLGTQTPIARLLSAQVFVPISKLSYAVFLIHLIPMYIWVGTSRTTAYINPLEVVSWSIADLVLCLVVSVPFYLAIETPPRYLTKYFTSNFHRPIDNEAKEQYAVKDQHFK